MVVKSDYILGMGEYVPNNADLRSDLLSTRQSTIKFDYSTVDVGSTVPGKFI